MKKILAIILCLAAVLSVCACATPFDSDLKKFTSGEFSVNLPKVFKEKDIEVYDAYFYYEDVFVWAIKDYFSNMDGSSEWTVDDYANIIFSANEEKSPSAVSKENGLVTIEYTVHNETKNKTFTYFTVMYKSSDAFWLVQFVCVDTEYEQYKPKFIEWAQTVKIG